MDKLMEINSAFDFNTNTSNAVETVIEPDKYQKFMSINPI